MKVVYVWRIYICKGINGNNNNNDTRAEQKVEIGTLNHHAREATLVVGS